MFPLVSSFDPILTGGGVLSVTHHGPLWVTMTDGGLTLGHWSAMTVCLLGYDCLAVLY